MFDALAPNRKVSIAPMMDCTDRYYRYFMRLLTRHTLLYTEMVTAPAIIHGDRQRLLGFDQREKPLAMQIGGSDPMQLAECAKVVEDMGYDEINLNVGCPSSRVQSGKFGACLMAEPKLVAQCVAAMSAAVSVPVTVKTRLGIDNQDSYQQLADFISTVAEAGTEVFMIHARKAWLKGLNPKQNRELPPLNYDFVYQIKKDFPQKTIVINGGITSIDAMYDHLQQVDGVMIGREAYRNPYVFADIDKLFFDDNADVLSRKDWLEAYFDYMRNHCQTEVPVRFLLRHLYGVFKGVPGSKYWRQQLEKVAQSAQQASVDVIQQEIDKLLNIMCQFEEQNAGNYELDSV